MRKFIVTLVTFSILLSCFCVYPYAQEDETKVQPSDYATSINPILITKDSSTILYEAESYPSGSNYKIVLDEDASGGEAVAYASPLLEGNSANVPANNVQYRLYIKASTREKVRIWIRCKISHETGNIAYSLGEAGTSYFNFYNSNNKVLNEYTWVLLNSIELFPEKMITINVAFRSAALIMDKIVLTTDMFFVPKGKGEYNGAYTLGKDTTDYDNLSAPLPPFIPINERPRVWINAEKLEEVKKNLSHKEHEATYAEVVKLANKQLDDKSIANTNTAGSVIKAKAFMYLLTKEENYGREAISDTLRWAEHTGTADTDLHSQRDRGVVMALLAVAYDWCYDLMDDDTKIKMIEYILYNASYLEIGYPGMRTYGRLNGHESEGDIFCALLSAGIAIYDEYPEMYNIAAGKYYEEMLSTRNYYHKMKFHGQGHDYDMTRLAFESFNILLMDYGVKPNLINKDAKYHLYDVIYSTRPDNYKLKMGDSFNPPTKGPLVDNQAAFFILGNYCKDPYLRDRFFRIFTGFSDVSHYYVGRVEFLIHNDPSVGRKSEKELPLTRYYGGSSGTMSARTGWNMGSGDYTNDMIVRMNLNEIYAPGHDHLDSGHFDIYYKGSLALDSGIYNGDPYYDENGKLISDVYFGSAHDFNYHKRTIAHNSMLIYDPDEDCMMQNVTVANDGGQRQISPVGGSYEKLVNESTIGKVMAVDYGEDMYAPSFSYIKGDITKAYSEKKLKQFTRSFVFFNFFDNAYPGALIVFDKVTSTNPEFKKTWLLHTEQEPEIIGNKQIADKTNYGDNGRLINETLLPSLDNATITKIGGEGHEFEVNGINYKSVTSKTRADFGQWRIELSPKTPAETDYFLNVLHVTDASGTIEPLDSELIEAGSYVGAKIKDRIAFFSKDDGRSTKTLSFKLDGEGEYEILVTDIQEGAWNLYKDGNLVQKLIATTNGGNLIFKGTSGNYKLVGDPRDGTEIEKNLNFLDYTKPLDNVRYLSFNSVYYDVEGIIEENDELFLPLDVVSKFANVTYKSYADKIIFSAKNKKAEVPINDRTLKNVNGKYYVNAFDSILKPVFSLKWTKNWGNIYSLSGGNIIADIYNDGKQGHIFVADVTGDDESLASEEPPINALDGLDTTKWNTGTAGGWCLYTFNDVYELKSIDVLWSVVRGHKFKVETSEDGVNYQTVFDGWSSRDFLRGTYQNIELIPTKAKYVKITGYGNDSDRPQWFNYNEIKFIGTK